jgi:flavin-dependent dehydrogenase
MLHFDAADRRLRGYAWDFPTVVGGEALVCRGVYKLRVGDAGEDDGDLHALLDERLDALGLDIARYKNKRYAERGFEPGGPVAAGSLMLVGEAAGIDPVTGEGIAQAIEYGAIAGRFLARVLAGRADVGEWPREVAGSRLARDLRIRHRFVSLFYGPARPAVERFFAGCPDAVYVGCQHFAGDPYDAMKLGEVLARGAAAWIGGAVSRALGGSE